MNSTKFLRTAFFIEHLRSLLLKLQDPGPSITEPLFSILLCFHVDRIAMIANIEKRSYK